MIEQTELVIKEWIYLPISSEINHPEKITSNLTLDVMKKTALNKKGIACKFTSKFVLGKDPILMYVAEDSYVIDIADVVDKNEILKMIRNSYSKYKEKFEFRKLGTILQNHQLNPLDESNINLDAIFKLLN